MNPTRQLITAAMLGAFAIVLELIPLYPKLGFIKIDIVGVPLVLAAMLLGLWGGLLAAAITTIGMVFTPTGWIGAVMKISATLPLIVFIGFLASQKKLSIRKVAVAGVLAIAVRTAGMILFNYYFAIPAFFGIPTDLAMQQFPAIWIAIPNILVGVIELVAVGYLYFKTPLSETLQ